MYTPPEIRSAAGIISELKNLPGPLLVATMEIPWNILQKKMPWTPQHVHFVSDMELTTLEHLNETLPPATTIVGIGGGSCCDTAKFLSWKRQAPMVLVPTIISVDAPLTNMIAVRIDNKVNYVGDIWPQKLLVDYEVIQEAPQELNRAGAADIVSIHTALYDWELARDKNNESWEALAASQARECLEELDQNAEAVLNVTPKGIDTIIDLYRREVEFCARINTSRPEEGSEHLVAYNVERVTQRHFVHGDLVALGIFLMTRLQHNAHEWIVDLMERVGLRYRVPDLTKTEVKSVLETLNQYITQEKMFYSVLNTRPVTADFINAALDALF